MQESYYRPFVKQYLYFDRHLNEMLYQVPQLFGPSAGPNEAFCFAAEERSAFGVIAFKDLPNKDIFMPSAAQVLALYRYDDHKQRHDNITDWALDQHKEKKPKDPTIREKFNTYRFADSKEKVIDLLQRVTTVSVRTQSITDAMKSTAR